MRLKDFHIVSSSTVTTNFEASVRATMESTHDHAMRLQESQQSTVTTNFEASVPATMESTHDHAMRLQASQQVAPPGILPPPCRAQSDLDEMSHRDLTYLFFFVWWRRLP
jgi:uncharacterized Rmd1/YagE family protein